MKVSASGVWMPCEQVLTVELMFCAKENAHSLVKHSLTSTQETVGSPLYDFMSKYSTS